MGKGERRDAARRAVDLAGRLTVRTPSRDAMSATVGRIEAAALVRDVSAGGFSVVIPGCAARETSASCLFGRGATVTLRIELPSTGRTATLVGTVAWIVRPPDDASAPIAIGVRAIPAALDAATRRTFETWVR